MGECKGEMQGMGYGGAMSGNEKRSVGEYAGEKLVPVTASMSSVHIEDNSADQCLMEWFQCITQTETTPWLVLDYGSEVQVDSVVLHVPSSTWAHRTRNVNIWVSSNPPVSNSELFTGGQLLGMFEGPATGEEGIEVKSDTELTGRYVVVQMDFTLKADNLMLKQVTAFGQGRIYIYERLSYRLDFE